jgi:hypothetical protein
MACELMFVTSLENYQHFKEGFIDMYTAKSLNIPWNPALGNHDIVANNSVQVKSDEEMR